MKKRFHIGFVIPRLLALICGFDLLLRVLQGGWGVFDSGGEIPHSKIPDEAFKRNASIRVPAIGGDLAAFANLSDASETRSIQFTTDEFGFRNGTGAGKVAALLFGDSYAVLNDHDDETLAAQLGAKIGCRVYNAASPDYEFRRPSIALIDALRRRVGMDKGFVIIEQLERQSFGKRAPKTRQEKFTQWWGGRLWDQLKHIQQQAPLRNYAEAKLRRIQDDRILPNGYADNVLSAALQNGDNMLFLRNEPQLSNQKGLPSLDYWIGIDKQLAERGLKLVIVLVPNKYTVYAPLLRDPSPLTANSGAVLDRLASALGRGGITAINLTAALRRQAATLAKRREYIYWRNDTHWKPNGVAIAADEIDRLVPELRSYCR
jgi:hypothetical protein